MTAGVTSDIDAVVVEISQDRFLIKSLVNRISDLLKPHGGTFTARVNIGARVNIEAKLFFR